MQAVDKSNTPFPEHFIQIKKDLTKGHEDAIVASWKELLDELAIRTKASINAHDIASNLN